MSGERFVRIRTPYAVFWDDDRSGKLGMKMCDRYDEAVSIATKLVQDGEVSLSFIEKIEAQGSLITEITLVGRREILAIFNVITVARRMQMITQGCQLAVVAVE